MKVTLSNGTEFWATLNTIDSLISKGFYLIWPADVPALQKALDVLLNHFKKPEFKSLLETHTELQQSIKMLRQLCRSIEKTADVIGRGFDLGRGAAPAAGGPPWRNNK